VKNTIMWNLLDPITSILMWFWLKLEGFALVKSGKFCVDMQNAHHYTNLYFLKKNERR
jgi:hypothetical protein